MSGEQSKKMRKLLRQEIQKSSDPRLVRQFESEKVAEAEHNADQSTLLLEEQSLTRLYKTFATTVWRMRNVIIDTETNGPKEGLDERAVAKLARYLTSLDGALEDAGVQVVADYDGMAHDEGNAVKVISYEDRTDLKREEYIETLLPTVRWTNEQGQIRLLQQAEVIVGRPAEAEKTANS